MKSLLLLIGAALGAGTGCSLVAAAPEKPRLPIPDNLVVLTFDDGNVSDLATVAKILNEHGFGATFFITSGWLGGDQRLTWPQVLKLQEAGFEIGCHTTSHPNLLSLSDEEVRKQISGFDRACAEHGIEKATSFSYHGVPDLNRHCSTPVERFRKDMKYLKDSGATVVSLRELSRYVDYALRPDDAFAPIARRLGLRAEKIRCDSVDPVPQFSWKLASNRWTQKQVAYRILVASSKAHLDRDQGDLWDSRKVSSDKTTGVAYAGPALEPGKEYWWKVQVWNRRDLKEIAKITPYQSEEMIT